MKTIILSLITIVSVLVIGNHLLSETPNERAERINRMADSECQTGNSEYDWNCYDWYYSQIEDRD